MNGLKDTIGVLAILTVVGGLIGLLDRKRFSPRWLIISAALVVMNDFFLRSGYGLIPDLMPWAHWNWQSKIISFIATFGIATLPAFGWRRTGITPEQNEGSLPSSLAVAFIYCLIFVALSFIYPSDPASPEALAFQLTMPGLEEEPFYRGILLYALDQAFAGRLRLLGVEWGWGAVLSCGLFGLAHAMDFTEGHYTFDILTMALTALPSFIVVWMRLRTGSVLLPILLHNFGNAVSPIL